MLLDTIHICGMPDEDTLKRLQQGGLEVNFYPAQYAEMAAETWREAAGDSAAGGSSPSSMPLVLGVEPVPPPMLAWRDVAPELASAAEGGQIPSTDLVMQAVVQYNRRQLLAAAAQHNSTHMATFDSAGTPTPPTATAAAAAPAAATGDAYTGAAASAAAAAADGLACSITAPPAVLVVGYVMKASREAALAAEGLLHLLPKDGVCFMPVDIDALTQQQTQTQQTQPSQQQQQPLQQQQQEPQEQQQQPQQQYLHIDILLHKASDELVPLGDNTSTGAAAPGGLSAVGVSWSRRLLALQSWLADHPDVCVVDPFEATAQVVDRLLLARVLQDLQGLPLQGGVRARGPAFLEATCFDDQLQHAVVAAGLHPPYIVKPRVACGVPHSHSMALVLSPQGLPQLQGRLPCPALVQQFVNHGGRQYKVYVLGRGQVFVTPRTSIPDITLTAGDTQVQQQKQVLFFDSLASLPTQLPQHLTAAPQQQPHAADTPAAAAAANVAAGQQLPPSGPDRAAVVQVADFLGSRLGLTLFGFDVVLPYSSPATPAAADKEEAEAAAAPPQKEQQQQQQPVEQAGMEAQQQPQQQPGQEMVVIDINYFPNYRGGSNTPAMFRRALRQAWQQHQQQLKSKGCNT